MTSPGLRIGRRAPDSILQRNLRAPAQVAFDPPAVQADVAHLSGAPGLHVCRDGHGNLLNPPEVRVTRRQHPDPFLPQYREDQ